MEPQATAASIIPMHGAAQAKMAIRILTIFLMIVSALLGLGAGTTIDDKIDITVEKTEPKCITVIEQPVKIIGYVNNCETGDLDKYFCDCVGPECPCESTEEILSKLG